QSAAELDGDLHLLDNRFHHIPVAWLARKGPVQIHHVQIARTVVFPTSRHRHRVVAVYRHGIGAPLLQPHHLAALQVDGGVNEEWLFDDSDFRSRAPCPPIVQISQTWSAQPPAIFPGETAWRTRCPPKAWSRIRHRSPSSRRRLLHSPAGSNNCAQNRRSCC